jgi:anti-anti-sigma factor
MDASCGLNLRIRHDGNAVVVLVRGELDFATSPELVNAIESNMRTDARLCLIDCSDVTFIDSEALKSLIRVQNQLVESGTDLRICGCSRQVMRTLQLLGLDERFLLHTTC